MKFPSIKKLSSSSNVTLDEKDRDQEGEKERKDIKNNEESEEDQKIQEDITVELQEVKKELKKVKETSDRNRSIFVNYNALKKVSKAKWRTRRDISQRMTNLLEKATKEEEEEDRRKKLSDQKMDDVKDEKVSETNEKEEEDVIEKTNTEMGEEEEDGISNIHPEAPPTCSGTGQSLGDGSEDDEDSPGPESPVLEDLFPFTL